MLELGLKNLRRLKHVEPIQIKPITILVGRNSSGKSTFLRSLPLLRQSITTRTSSPVLWYGDFVDFDSFDNAVFSGNLHASIEFVFGVDKIDIEQHIFIDEDENYVVVEPASLEGFRVTLSVQRQEKGTRISRILIEEKKNALVAELMVDEKGEVEKIVIDGRDVPFSSNEMALRISSDSILPQLSWRLRDEPVGLSGVPRGRGPKNPLKKKIEAAVLARMDGRSTAQSLARQLIPLYSSSVFTEAELSRLHSRVNSRSLGKLLQEIGKRPGSEFFRQLRALLLVYKIPSWVNSFFRDTREVFANVLYIGPVRARSDRYYRYQDLAVAEIDPDGKNFPMFLNSLTDNQQEKFSGWVRELFGYGVKVMRPAGHISINLVYDHGTVNIVDTGYGVSQILPVLGQIWWARNRPSSRMRNSENREPLIAIEQPELHLHPAHQALLADAFVGSTRGGAPSEKKKRVHFLVETHSEALINRLGELIARNEIESDDVQIVIFEPDPSDERITTARTVNFNKDGYLEDWPYGFFVPSVADDHSEEVK